jgi:signal transduction histidine kinase
MHANPEPDSSPARAARADAARLDDLAWAAQYRDRQRAVALGQALVEAAADDPAWQGRGWFHVALVHVRQGERDAGELSHARACAAARIAQDPLLDALCRDLQAQQLRNDHQHAQAMELLESNLTMGEAERGLSASIYSFTVASQCCMSLGLLDRSLKLRYHALGLAETLDDPAVIANACANLSGVQNDLLNLEDGHALSARAVEAADRAGLQGLPLWLTSTFNLTLAQLQGHEPQQALATARRMQACQAQVPVAKRARYEVLWATAALKAGHAPEAEQWLAAARERWPREADVIVEWYVTRAMLDNRLGRAAAARAVCDRARELTLSGGDEVLPIDLMQLYDEGARACEALGDLAAALAYKRLAFEQYELLAGRSARARRVTAEIQHALDLARRARDEAQRRRRDAEAEKARLATLNEALRQASETRTRFLAAASHDLRQPLHALGLLAARLGDQVAAGPAQQTVARMARSVASLTGMFDSLLDLSRIEAGAVEPDWQSVALAPLLVQLVEEFGPEADRRGLRLALRISTRAQALQLHSDAVLLDRLLRNLIGNALKYTHTGGVLVALRRAPSPDPAADAWRVQVFDTGIGIDEDDLPRIFDAFHRVDGADRTRVEGLGLGLSIVQRLSVLLGHPLHLRSRPGSGSCFGITLVRAPLQACLPTPADRWASRPIAAGTSIALAEDDDDAREAMEGWLRDAHCRVIAAHSGDALLQRLDAEPGLRPDALITDLRMPGRLDGLALARAWQSRFGAAAPVLLVTGEAALPAAAPGLRLLRKPVKAAQLQAWLAELRR